VPPIETRSRRRQIVNFQRFKKALAGSLPCASETQVTAVARSPGHATLLGESGRPTDPLVIKLADGVNFRTAISPTPRSSRKSRQGTFQGGHPLQPSTRADVGKELHPMKKPLF